MNIFSKLFKKPTPKVETPQKDLSTLKQFDDVWIQINDEIYEGWVVNIVNGEIQIVFSDRDNKLQDISFMKDRPLNRTFIKEKYRTLYLNNPNYGIGSRNS